MFHLISYSSITLNDTQLTNFAGPMLDIIDSEIKASKINIQNVSYNKSIKAFINFDKS